MRELIGWKSDMGHISRIGIRFGFRTGERLKRQERDCRKVKADPGKIRAGSKAWW